MKPYWSAFLTFSCCKPTKHGLTPSFIWSYFQKQPSSETGVLKKRCSDNTQQIYRRTPMPKCDFKKVAKQLCLVRTSAWVFSCNFTAYFQNTFPRNISGWLLLYSHPFHIVLPLPCPQTFSEIIYHRQYMG